MIRSIAPASASIRGRSGGGRAPTVLRFAGPTFGLIVVGTHFIRVCHTGSIPVCAAVMRFHVAQRTRTCDVASRLSTTRSRMFAPDLNGRAPSRLGAGARSATNLAPPKNTHAHTHTGTGTQYKSRRVSGARVHHNDRNDRMARQRAPTKQNGERTHRYEERSARLNARASSCGRVRVCAPQTDS